MSIEISGARVLLAEEVVETSVLIENGVIAAIGDSARGDRVIDGRGLLLAPALIGPRPRSPGPRPGEASPCPSKIFFGCHEQ